MQSSLIFSSLVCAALLSACSAIAPEPKLSLGQARELALQQVSGVLVKEEYEKEDGIWRYSFDIRETGRIHEIGIDATSGRVVEDSWEDAR
ncbi:MAG: PepSY domain-containing protein [Pseudomonadales bacterium]|nr:PepSY domain-containing protein [Pseudomonadales bacterium]